MKGLITCVVALLAALPQQTPPVFRARADIAVLDVIVTDNTGAAITTLAAGDFTITTKKGARPISSIEFVRTRLPAATAPIVMPEPDLVPLRASTNAGRPLGRAFLLAVDVGEIRGGEGRLAMQQVSAFIDSLPPQDLVGLVILPVGTPRVELTTDRRLVREVLTKTAGASDRYRSCALTLGEAAGISMGDPSASRAYQERLIKARCPPGGLPRTLAIAEFRMQTRSKLDALGALAERMSRLSGQKTMVLVSEGLYSDRETQADIARFGARANAAQVRLYSLHLDTPVAEAGYIVPADTHNLDDHLGFDGMADAATVTGGAAIRAITRATGPLERIDRESSGYYLISVETDPAERDGKPVDFKIRVKTPGLDVRARPAFTNAAPPTSPRIVPGDLKAAIADTLRWPVDEAALRIDLDVVRLTPARAMGTSTALMLVEFSDRPAAIGFEITDANGAVVSDGFESPVASLVSTGSRFLYVGSASLHSGAYRIKLAAISADGTRGGATHAFNIAAATPGAVSMTDILLGEDNSDPWRPTATLAAKQSRVGVRVDFSAPSAGALSLLTARLRVGRVGAAGWVAEATLPITASATDPLTHSARGALNVAVLATGDYVLKVELRSGETIVSSSAKVIRIAH